MNIKLEATITTKDEVIHNVYHEDKQIGFIVKTNRENKPYHFLDMTGDSGNAESIEKAVKNLCVKNWFLNAEKEKRNEVMVAILAMMVTGEL
ncbi:hypothetical protein RVX82_000981 [Citrobacter braakii]|nr:hypothetical protein [Citrobacter braakii]